jgi:2-amino-4-hydroxy-6-hydroxymethyldihydropteridine diphosphokinase
MLAYIAVGSNQGNALENCRKAMAGMVSDGRNRLLRGSSFYLTEPVGKKNQEWFVNAVVELDTSLPPRELMAFLLSIEDKMGRIRGERWGPRIIDLDILLYDGEEFEEEGLKIPHPRLHERKFVLVPLKEIAPDLKHPVLKKTISEILAELKEGDKVIPLEEGSAKICTD